VGSVQPVTQLPQRNEVVTAVSQPVLGLPVQLRRPSMQALRRLHTPRSQVTREASTPGRAVQSLPQRPQLRVSVSVSTQTVPQTMRHTSGRGPVSTMGTSSGVAASAEPVSRGAAASAPLSTTPVSRGGMSKASTSGCAVTSSFTTTSSGATPVSKSSKIMG
jgi:hypothetical protein